MTSCPSQLHSWTSFVSRPDRHTTSPPWSASFAATVLIGATGVAGAFTEPVIRQMAGAVTTPMIMPLSNPTSSSEATPADLLAWTDGRPWWQRVARSTRWR